ncbi:hypothetical protein [Hymenobacter yonginensis]|uniref:Uncharacterized protein n=1 Tax=Hymenobacter yonginensis TaxID=748197 RepID=A0ABY7PV52_9BACT|nr:hypothetical protein [Hymenobacter yonginensis]WBO86788.1 hypothetical protein O9Z63_20090 [Hymenobacter yonginensis]
MFRSLFPFRRLLATSFLLVFVNVFVGQCYCASLKAAPVASNVTAPAAARSTHPGCHGHATATARQKPAKACHGQAGSHPAGKHDCCKDKSATLLKSLAAPAEKQLLTPAPAVLPAGNDFFFRPAAGRWDRAHAVVLVLREHLPPKIPDIRIFIQSLTV